MKAILTYIGKLNKNNPIKYTNYVIQEIGCYQLDIACA